MPWLRRLVGGLQPTRPELEPCETSGGSSFTFTYVRLSGFSFSAKFVKVSLSSDRSCIVYGLRGRRYE
jgi:hypothetical protein